MPEHAAIYFDNDEMALTDRDLFSLYLRYPEMEQSDHNFQEEVYAEPPLVSITTSSPESSPQSAQLYSSPLPNLTRYESPTSSPLGPPDSIPFPALTIAANEEEVEELTAQFDLTLKSHEIPDDTAEVLAEIKSEILTMGTVLFSATGEVSTDLENIWRVMSSANWLISVLKHAGNAVDGELNDIESILQLAPFTVRPALEDLWTNYKQMAELIIDYTTIPSAWVIDLCHQLCLIYDASVYRPVLAIPRAQGQDEELLEHLDNLYNAIMMVSTKYKQWMAAMKRVGDDFTKPTMRRVLQSPGVMESILQFEGQMETATKSVQQMEFETKKVVATLTAKNRRKQQQLWKRGISVLHRGHASIS